jgi:hypothetical protein
LTIAERTAFYIISKGEHESDATRGGVLELPGGAPGMRFGFISVVI